MSGASAWYARAGLVCVTDAFRVFDARSRAARAIEYDWPGDRAVIRIS